MDLLLSLCGSSGSYVSLEEKKNRASEINFVTRKSSSFDLNIGGEQSKDWLSLNLHGGEEACMYSFSGMFDRNSIVSEAMWKLRGKKRNWKERLCPWVNLGKNARNNTLVGKFLDRRTISYAWFNSLWIQIRGAPWNNLFSNVELERTSFFFFFFHQANLSVRVISAVSNIRQN